MLAPTSMQQSCRTALAGCLHRPHVRGQSPTHPRVVVCCSGQQNSNNHQDFEQLAQQILQQDLSSMEKIARVEAAAERVQRLQEQQAQLEAALQQASEGDAAAALAEYEQRYGAQSDTVAMETAAASANVMAARQEVEAAEMAVLQARMERAQLAEEANKAVDRLESAKAGAIAAVGGVASSAPLLLATGGTDGLSNLLSIGTVLATSLLLGVTYRHTVREDLQDVHLKSGVVVGFGLVRAMGGFDVSQAAATAAAGPSALFSVDVIGRAALFAGESMLSVAFAALAVDYALQQGWIKPRSGNPESALDAVLRE